MGNGFLLAMMDFYLYLVLYYPFQCAIYTLNSYTKHKMMSRGVVTPADNGDIYDRKAISFLFF